MEQVVIYLLMVEKLLNSTQKMNSEIVATPLCIANISKDWSVDNMKRTWFSGYVYNVSVDDDAIAVDDILDIHKYLMKKSIWYKNVWVY